MERSYYTVREGRWVSYVARAVDEYGERGQRPEGKVQ